MNYARRTKGRTTCGQALAEMGIVVLLLVTMLMGIIEFGRMLMLTNMVVHAVRDGARIAAVTPGTTFPDAEQHVKDLLNGLGVQNLAVSSSEKTDPGTGIDTVTVTVTGTIPYIFGFFGASDLNINRSVTFRHEA
jgi:Flp pilus assembly protein TadG